jgi:hypothetical protein
MQPICGILQTIYTYHSERIADWNADILAATWQKSGSQLRDRGFCLTLILCIKLKELRENQKRSNELPFAFPFLRWIAKVSLAQYLLVNEEQALKGISTFAIIGTTILAL